MKSRGLFCVVVVVMLAVAGCAVRQYRPMVDTRGVDMNQYALDERECAQYASQVDQGSSTAAGVVGGAVVGAVIGSLLGSGRDTRNLAAAGAIVGGVGSAAASSAAQQDIFRRCMAGRGYRVLN